MENQIDHICRKCGRSLLDVRSKRIADIASDHHILISEIRQRIARIHRQEVKIVEELENRAADIPEGGNVEDQWSAIKNAFIATGENYLGELRTRRKQLITDDTWRQIEEQRNAKAAIERAKTR